MSIEGLVQKSQGADATPLRKAFRGLTPQSQRALVLKRMITFADRESGLRSSW